VTETAAFDDLGADSLMVVELIMGLEEEFNTTIADEEAQGLKTIGDVVEFIKNKLK
jgi:acyl carrier protein